MQSEDMDMSPLLANSSAAYRTVLEKLIVRRRELDVAIQAISSMLVETDIVRPAAAPVQDPLAEHQPRVAKAIHAVLESLDRPARNLEIKRALLDRGYRFTAVDPDISIVQALNRLRRSRVVDKVGRGLWTKRTVAG